MSASKAKKAAKRAVRKPTSIERLMAALDRVAAARGNAEWTNGYRTGKLPPKADDDRLYERQMAEWKVYDEAQRNFRRLAIRLLRGAR